MAKHGRKEQKIKIRKDPVKEDKHKPIIALLIDSSPNIMHPKIHSKRIFRPATKLFIHKTTIIRSNDIE